MPERPRRSVAGPLRAGVNTGGRARDRRSRARAAGAGGRAGPAASAARAARSRSRRGRRSPRLRPLTAMSSTPTHSSWPAALAVSTRTCTSGRLSAAAGSTADTGVPRRPDRDRPWRRPRSPPGTLGERPVAPDPVLQRHRLHRVRGRGGRRRAAGSARRSRSARACRATAAGAAPRRSPSPAAPPRGRAARTRRRPRAAPRAADRARSRSRRAAWPLRRRAPGADRRRRPRSGRRRDGRPRRPRSTSRHPKRSGPCRSRPAMKGSATAATSACQRGRARRAFMPC